jgi:DNA-binding transcriptional ArsR family regulator
MVNTSRERRLNLVFAALADPTRRAMLRTLARGDFRVTELARPHDMSLPAISKHIKVLERAGLVRRTRDGPYRVIQLRTAELRGALRWLTFYASDSWTVQLERLDRLLSEPGEDRTDG